MPNYLFKLNTSIKKHILFIHIFLIIVLGFILYLNSLKGGFLWDDTSMVENNFLIRIPSLHNVLRIFFKNTGTGSAELFSFYRPVQILTYMLDHVIWKLNAFGYHLTNLLFHILTGLFVYWLTAVIFNSKPFSFITSILFITHPVHTEAVSYISGRTDMLSASFMLLSFILYIKFLNSNNRKLYAPILLMYLLALLSKENAVIFPALLLLYHYSFKKQIQIKILIPILCLLPIYVLLRGTTTEPMFYQNEIILKRIPGFFVAINNYLRILFIPINLHMEYGNKFFSPFTPKALSGLIILFSLFFMVFTRKKGRDIFLFSIGWFFLALLPSSSIYPINAFFMAEHWLYFPSIGFFLLLAKGLISLYNRIKTKHISIGIMTIILLIYSYLTIQQNYYWCRPILFYERILQFTPDSHSAYINIGTEYLKVKNIEKAVESYKAAIKINPDKEIAYYNLGITYLKAGDKIKALEFFNKTLEKNPNYAKAYYSICYTHINDNNNEEGINYCKKAVSLTPDLSEAWYLLGNAYYNTGEINNAIRSYQKAIEINPADTEAYNNLAATYTEIAMIDEAIELWNKVAKIQPDFPIVHLNLAMFYFQKKQYRLAVYHCDKAIHLGQKIPPDFLNLLAPHR